MPDPVSVGCARDRGPVHVQIADRVRGGADGAYNRLLSRTVTTVPRWRWVEGVRDPLADGVVAAADEVDVNVVQDACAGASTGGMGTMRMVPSGRCLRPRGSKGVPVLVQAVPVRGQAAVRTIFPRPRAGRMRSSRRRATASSGRSAA